MNTLYGLLVSSNPPASDSWYYKRYDAVTTTDKANRLIAAITTGVHAARLALYVSKVCNIVLSSVYGSEIQKLDPNNTYVAVTRPTDSDHSASAYCMFDLVQPLSAYRDILSYLDDDITAQLDKQSWPELMGAGCLQLLRECV